MTLNKIVEILNKILAAGNQEEGYEDASLLRSGKWVESEKVQKILSLTFKECFCVLEFCRTAEWWSVAGTTEEEKKRNGQKVVCYFRLPAELAQ